MKSINVTYHNVEQRSPEWFALRNEHPLTASDAQAIGNNGKGLETLVWEKLAEKHSTAEKEQYTNPDMQRGVELEEHARSLYELETGAKVVTVGFATNDTVSKHAGASPDGLIESEGLLEIKCPSDIKHFRMIAEGAEVESQYAWQMQMQMLRRSDGSRFLIELTRRCRPGFKCYPRRGQWRTSSGFSP